MSGKRWSVNFNHNFKFLLPHVTISPSLHSFKVDSTLSLENEQILEMVLANLPRYRSCMEETLGI